MYKLLMLTVYLLFVRESPAPLAPGKTAQLNRKNASKASRAYYTVFNRQWQHLKDPSPHQLTLEVNGGITRIPYSLTSSELMQHLHSYISLLREAIDDLVDAFESETTRGFMIAAMVLIPVFGTLLFVTLLISA